MAKKTKVSAEKTKSSSRSVPPVGRGAKKVEKTKSSSHSVPPVVSGVKKAKGVESIPVRKPPAKVSMSQAERKNMAGKLVALREEMTGQITALKNDALTRNDEVNAVEDGTDAYDRQLGLSLASSEQEAVVQINDALRRLDDGTYGKCEECEGTIEKARLDALPFVRTCIRCQSELERNNSKFRPSAGTTEPEQWDENRTPSAEGGEEET